MKAKLVVMFRALKSGELFVEEGTVAVMRLGNHCVMVAAKKKRNRVQGVGYGVGLQRGENETADIRTLWRHHSG